MTPTALSTLTPLSPTMTEATIELTKSGISQFVQPITPSSTSPSPTNEYSSEQSSSPSDPATLSAFLTIHTPNPSPRTIPSSTSSFNSTKTTTDHMLTCTWSSTSGWSAPHLQPYGPLSLHPTASVLHYSTTCFEGLKCYRGVDGRMRLFRPRLNCERMIRSAKRVALPTFDPQELQKLIEMVVARDAPRWLPRERGPGFLYLRPTLVGTGEAIGVQRPTEALLFIVAVLMPPMDRPQAPSLGLGLGLSNTVADNKQTEKKLGMRLLASSPSTCRSWPGGFGHAKVGANYGPTLAAQGEARERGYDQVLWLFGPEGRVTEAGASNFFVVWRNEETGRRQLVTAPVRTGGDEADGGLILEGVTRRSVLEAVENGWVDFTGCFTDHGNNKAIEVVERDFTMDEVLAAHCDGRLEEAFGSGTAFFIAPVQEIDFRGEVVKLPLREGEGDILAGCPVAMAVKRFLKGVMYGEISGHEWGVVVDEEREERM